MRIKSKHLKKWNLPGYGTKLDCVKSKPYPVLFAFLAASVILFSLNQKVIGIALLALTCYQLGVGNNSTICEFLTVMWCFMTHRIMMAVTFCSGRMWHSGSIAAASSVIRWALRCGTGPVWRSTRCPGARSNTISVSTCRMWRCRSASSIFEDPWSLCEQAFVFHWNRL